MSGWEVFGGGKKELEVEIARGSKEAMQAWIAQGLPPKTIIGAVIGLGDLELIQWVHGIYKGKALGVPPLPASLALGDTSLLEDVCVDADDWHDAMVAYLAKPVSQDSKIEFIEKCIAKGVTDFDIVLKVSNRCHYFKLLDYYGSTRH